MLDAAAAPPNLFGEDDLLESGQPLEKLISAAARGATLTAPTGDLTLPWALQLASLFDGINLAVSADSADVPPIKPPCSVEVSLRLEVRLSAFSLMFEIQDIHVPGQIHHPSPISSA